MWRSIGGGAQSGAALNRGRRSIGGGAQTSKYGNPITYKMLIAHLLHSFACILQFIKRFATQLKIIVFRALTQYRSENEIPDLQKLAVVLFGCCARGFSN